MNASPLPVAELLLAAPGLGPGTPASGIDSATLIDPRLLADPLATLRGAADFAALLLQSAERTASRPNEIPASESVAEAPAAPTCLAPAIDALLFMASLQTPSVGPVAVTTLRAATARETSPSPAIDALASPRIAPGEPAEVPVLDLRDQVRVDPSRLPLIAPLDDGAWRPKLPGFEAPDADADQRGFDRNALASHLKPPAVDMTAGDDGSRRVAESLLSEAKALFVAAGNSSPSSTISLVATAEPMPSIPQPPSAASPAPVTVTVTIETPIHDTTWRVDAANRIAALVTRGVEHAELRVTPPELGPVELRIDLRGAEATLAIVATNATTREALEQALPMLRDMLAQQGLALGEATVRDGREQGQAGGHGSSAPRTASENPSDAALPVEAPPPHLQRLIDVFA